MAKKKKPHKQGNPQKRQDSRKAPGTLETIYMVVAILAGIVNIVYAVWQMLRAS